MAHERRRRRLRKLYGVLLRLYPRSFRERFAEPMEQTFNDLLRERGESGKPLIGFAFRMCLETAAGIVVENLSIAKAKLMTKRMTVWLAVVSVILMVPLLAMRWTDEVKWGPLDFAFMGALLLGTGFACELIVRKAGVTSHKVAAGIGIAAVFLLVWLNAAVGIVGEPGGPNILYFAVLLTGMIGTALARFESRGMALTLFTMATAQILVTATAIALGNNEPPALTAALCLNGLFVALFVGSGLLFRRASRSAAA